MTTFEAYSKDLQEKIEVIRAIIRTDEACDDKIEKIKDILIQGTEPDPTIQILITQIIKWHKIKELTTTTGINRLDEIKTVLYL